MPLFLRVNLNKFSKKIPKLFKVMQGYLKLAGRFMMLFLVNLSYVRLF